MQTPTVQHSTNRHGQLATLTGVILLVGVQSAYSQTSDIVFRGHPEHKVESYEDRDIRFQLRPEDVKEAEVVIVSTKDGCRWKSRDNRRVTARTSGGYLIFETQTPSASYLKIVRGISGQYTAPREIGFVFLEHVSQGLNTISYRGRSVEVHQPERCQSQ